jgi:hypothetical protein
VHLWSSGSDNVMQIAPDGRRLVRAYGSSSSQSNGIMSSKVHQSPPTSNGWIIMKTNWRPFSIETRDIELICGSLYTSLSGRSNNTPRAQMYRKNDYSGSYNLEISMVTTTRFSGGMRSLDVSMSPESQSVAWHVLQETVDFHNIFVKIMATCQLRSSSGRLLNPFKPPYASFVRFQSSTATGGSLNWAEYLAIRRQRRKWETVTEAY